MSDYIFTTYALEGGRLPATEVTFTTLRKNSDRYSVRVRNAWRMEAHYLLAAELLRAGDWFIDGGANIGTFSIPVARMTGARGVMVEALPENCDLLAASLMRNPGLDLQILNNALGGSGGTVFISGTSAYAKTSEHAEHGTAVEKLVLEDVLSRIPGGRAKLLKIDIEGSEYETFEGAAGLLGEGRIDHVIYESNGPVSMQAGYTVHDLRSSLIRRGYTLYTIIGHALVPTGEDDFQFSGNVDLLATRRPLDGIGTFRVRDLPIEKQAEMVVRALTEMAPQYRDFMLAELDHAPASIREHPAIIAALEAEA